MLKSQYTLPSGLSSEKFREIENSALAELQANGLEPGSIQWDAGLVRCPVSGKSSSNKGGAYLAHLDRPTNIWWQNFPAGTEGKWFAQAESKFSAKDKKIIAKRREADRKLFAEELARCQNDAAAKARDVYETATSCVTYPYLSSKGVSAVDGLRVSRGALTVPIFDEQNEIMSLQFINADGTKRFLSGGRKHGGFFPIGGDDRATTILIAEGLATALSLHQCLGLPTIVALDAGNLKPVAELMRRRFPDMQIVLCADNDVCEEGDMKNTGVIAATEAAEAVKGTVVVPYMDGRKCDWNDLHRESGADEVKLQFEAALADAAEDEDENEIVQNENLPYIGGNPPMAAFTPQIQNLLKEISDACSCPMPLAIASLLAFSACLIGTSRWISIKLSWKEPAILWICVVARSGTGKTPCMRMFLNAIDRLEQEEFVKWLIANEKYNAELADYDILRGKKKDGGKRPPMPKKPERKQLYVDDSTTEAIGEVLSQNERGGLLLKDELSGFFAESERYRSGKGGMGVAKPRLMTCYDAGPWKISRVSDKERNTYIASAGLSIFGGIQPGVLTSVFDAGTSGLDEAAGFLQRFAFVFAQRDRPAKWTEATLTEESEKLLERLAKIILSWEIRRDSIGILIRQVVVPTAEAKELFKTWFDDLAEQEFLADEDAPLLAKIRAQGQRVVLVLHCLEQALEGKDGLSPISADVMQRGLMLMDWIKEQQKYVWRMLRSQDAKAPDPITKAIMEVVVENADTIEKAGWRIPFGELHQLVKQKLNMPMLPTQRTVKAANALKLTAGGWRGKDRVREVSQEKLSSFKKAVGAVGCVGAPTLATLSAPTDTVGEVLVAVGRQFEPARFTNSTYTASTATVGGESVAAVGAPTVPTAPTLVSEVKFDLCDFNDAPPQRLRWSA
jgi:phage/plasmid primase-like uncharacterized protein